MNRMVRNLLILLITTAFAILPKSNSLAETPNLPIERCKVIGNNTKNSEHRFEDAGHVADWSKFLKPEDEVRMLVLPLDFSDTSSKKSAMEEIHFLDKVKKFFSEKSNSKMSLTIEAPLDWVQMPKPAAYYKSAIWSEKINDAIDTVDSIIDFSKYDLVLFYISKLNKITTEAGALPGYPDRAPDGIEQIRGVFLGNDFWRQKGQDDAVTTHEMMHVFGLPDLYQTNKNGTKNVGVYDLMSEYIPSVGMQLFTWNRWKLGWIDDVEVKCLNPKNKHTILVNSKNLKNGLWIFPMKVNQLVAIQAWRDGPKIRAIAYKVDPKDFVWNSAGFSGSGESPIQMLRPVRAGTAPKAFVNRNLEVTLQPRDVVISSWGTLKVTSNGNGLKILFSPKEP